VGGATVSEIDLDVFVVPPPGWEHRMEPVPEFLDDRERKAEFLEALLGPELDLTTPARMLLPEKPTRPRFCPGCGFAWAARPCSRCGHQ